MYKAVDQRGYKTVKLA